MTGTTPESAPDVARVHRLDALLARLRAPIDGSSLAVFRIVFGLIALIEVYRYFAHAWISRYWVDPTVHFTYTGFGWVHPMGEAAMHALWMILGGAAAGIMLGIFYRASCLVFALGFGYSFLLESARYLNHFYLIALLALLLAFVPADRVWTLDVRIRKPPKPEQRGVPAWSLWLLRFQVGVVYVYGAIAKMESDWLRGEPMGTWLADESDRPLVGSLLAQEWMGPAMAWAGLFFDLLIVFAVWWRPTRIPALIAAASFHFINNNLFDIGVFPYLAFAALLLFCEPDWPRRIQRRMAGPTAPPLAAFEPPPPITEPRKRMLAKVALAVAAVFVVAQLTIPLRHVVFSGKSNWTEAGHTFAWHMKLRIKDGEATFVVLNPDTRQAVMVDPNLELASWQYSKMAVRPEMLRQYAHHLADRFAEGGLPDVKVYARTSASLNGRPHQPLVDPSVDLAAEPASLGTPSWVVPLKHPLP